MAEFATGCATTTPRGRPRRGDYAALHTWSVEDLEGFWSAVAEFLGVRFHDAPTAVLGCAGDAGRRVVPRGHAELRRARARRASRRRRRRSGAGRSPARTGWSAPSRTPSCASSSRRARAGLVALGVGRGDRVVALAPNSVETLVAFLAAASLGAIWSSCSPDFGAAGRARPVRPDRAGGPARRRRLRLRRQALRHPADRRHPAHPTADAARHRARALPRSRRDPRRRAAVVRADRRPRARWSSSRCRSTTRCGCCTPPARPGCPRASSTATAGSCWST